MVSIKNDIMNVCGKRNAEGLRDSKRKGEEESFERKERERKKKEKKKRERKTRIYP